MGSSGVLVWRRASETAGAARAGDTVGTESLGNPPCPHWLHPTGGLWVGGGGLWQPLATLPTELEAQGWRLA